NAELCRYKLLEQSGQKRLSALAKKIHGELKYHVMHANTWIKKLAKANEQSRSRILSSVKEVYPLALGIFEKSEWEKELMKKGIFEGEEKLHQEWLKSIQPITDVAEIILPLKNIEPVYGGRKGFHTEHLKPLL